MLCEKCKNKGGDCKMTAQGQGFTMGFYGRHPVHQSDGKWFPGTSRKDLEDWCAKNCKEVKEVKEVKEKTFTPATKKIEALDGKKNTPKPSWNYKNKKKD